MIRPGHPNARRARRAARIRRGSGQLPRPAKVFLLAGQSNMVGSGWASQLDPPESEPLPGVYYYVCNFYTTEATFEPEGRFEPLAPGLKLENPSSFGPELSFGHRIRKYIDPRYDVYLIEYSQGSTDLHNEWNIAGDGPIWGRFVDVFTKATDDLKRARVQYDIEGFIWMQGESDAGAGTWERVNAYEDNLYEVEFGEKETEGSEEYRVAVSFPNHHRYWELEGNTVANNP